jgi:hypothetical protein
MNANSKVDYGTSTHMQSDGSRQPRSTFPRVIVTNHEKRPNSSDESAVMYYSSNQEQQRLLEDLVEEIDQPARNATSEEGDDECCIQHPIVELLLGCFPLSCIRSSLIGGHVQRAICFGAIDGMLTGSGITAACVGMGFFQHLWANVVNPTLHQHQRWIVLVLSLAACASDGLCMGISHICSSALIREQGKKDRDKEEWIFHHFRNVSKARMVDALMHRGMLKLDAMSIVDTLEGYPDIFINALVGEAQGLGPLGIAEDVIDHPTVNAFQHSSSYRAYVDDDHLEDEDRHFDYCYCSSSYCIPEFLSEGFLMMISFSLFSIFPSAIYGYVFSQPEMGPSGISRESLTITLLSLINFTLGAWKTKYVPGGSCFLFGIEAIVLLLISIFSSYGIGYIFITCIYDKA